MDDLYKKSLALAAGDIFLAKDKFVRIGEHDSEPVVLEYDYTPPQKECLDAIENKDELFWVLSGTYGTGKGSCSDCVHMACFKLSI